ncbi:MAG: DUF72 domain-containing protein [Comamonadaceae bacterium]|nr:MAG: DUF72 domain-containing protein [Comamonadaceae bacterium]
MPGTTLADEEARRGGLRIGCAGWSLPRAHQPAFAAEGSHLERYAAGLSAVEINSSFYRPHRREVYQRWAEATPTDFRFSVKLPKAITHEAKLGGIEAPLDRFLDEISGLGQRLGCLLVQLPPSLAFDHAVAAAFLALLRERHAGGVALEPRHASWFAPEADRLLADRAVARVLADPVLHPGGEAPGGFSGLVYLRLHGSPRRYWSAYAPEWLERLSERLRRAMDREAAECWCIFDNTAGGEAVGDALALSRALRRPRSSTEPFSRATENPS